MLLNYRKEEKVMVVIAGCLKVRDNRILLVKETKKKCYGQWNFLAGHVDEHELITEAAIRESYEETGCKVNLTGVLPISCVDFEDGKIYQLDIFNNITYIRYAMKKFIKKTLWNLKFYFKLKT